MRRTAVRRTVAGNPSSCIRSLWLVTLVCGGALIAVGPGCGGYSSPPATDAGAGGHVGTGGQVTGFGGSTPGGGGAGMGGAIGTGGSGTGGAVDAGTDTADMVDGGNDGPSDAPMCETGALDTDHDGTPDCLDACPTDPNKITDPGVCGCGVFDSDSDNDGVFDCLDQCPGISDALGTIDTDHDGVIDCLDACPKDPDRKTSAGICGCGGVPDTTPFCLVHRYSFKDTTATIADSITIANVSPKNGMAFGTMPANDRITLAGGASGQYVSLPAGTISSLGNNVTFEAWVIWTPPAGIASPWQRILDFGNSTVPGGTGVGQTYIFLTPSAGTAAGLMRGAITLASGGTSEDVTDGTSVFPAATALPTHVALVVNGSNLTMTLYVNGVSNGTPATLRNQAVLSVGARSAIRRVDSRVPHLQQGAGAIGNCRQRRRRTRCASDGSRRRRTGGGRDPGRWRRRSVRRSSGAVGAVAAYPRR
jgi:hypothetical protein